MPEASVSSNFLVFLFVFISFFFPVPFPKARENLSLVFIMKTWQGFCRQKSVKVCGLETGLLGVFNSQTKFTFRTQKFIKIATCILLPGSSYSGFWSWLLSSVPICLSRFKVMVCPISTDLWWIEEKSLIFILLGIFSPCYKNIKFFPCRSWNQKGSWSHLILPSAILYLST